MDDAAAGGAICAIESGPTAFRNCSCLTASVTVVVLDILENKKPANHAGEKQIVFLVLVVVLNILETRSQQTMQKTAPFC